MIVMDITNIGDPQILLYEDKYYCYATYNDGNSGGFNVWISDDLTETVGEHILISTPTEPTFSERDITLSLQTSGESFVRPFIYRPILSTRAAIAVR